MLTVSPAIKRAIAAGGLFTTYLAASADSLAEGSAMVVRGIALTALLAWLAHRASARAAD